MKVSLFLSAVLAHVVAQTQCSSGKYYSPNLQRCVDRKQENRYCNAVQLCAEGLKCSAKTHACEKFFNPFVIETPEMVLDMQPIGGHTGLIPEASDAGSNPAFLVDGQSGDTDFPHGNLKAIGTVGEYHLRDGKITDVLVGVPDGMGSYLLDKDTVRMVVQSESYGPISGYQSYPYAVNNGAATFTGSHVQYADYDRELLSQFMNHDGAASDMVTGFGELIEHMYNLKGEKVGARSTSGATSYGAHFSNTDPEGNWVTREPFPAKADWTMMSLCSAHLEEPHQWAPGMGVEDRLFITPEEWTALAPDCESYVGLSAHVVDPATKTSYAVGSMTNSGFEKIIEFKSGHNDYVAFSPSGYNGNFGSYDALIAKRNALKGARSDNKPYVKPQDIVPARVYIGKKGYNAKGEPASDFLSRNGLAFGQLYGFATDTGSVGNRDAWHKEHNKGDTVQGAFFPLEWQWDGEVKSFEHDGAWEFQDKPAGAPVGHEFWTGGGKDKAGAKWEHNTPLLDGRSGFLQGSTAGYFGEYDLTRLAQELAGLGNGEHFPSKLEAEYYVYQGESSIKDLIDLGGKGMRADGGDQTTMNDGSKQHESFEDIDGLEIIAAKDNKYYAVIQEDGGNAYGERVFITELAKGATPMDYKFVAMAGGKFNSRTLAGASVPAGTSGKPTASEFSGVSDLSALIAKQGNSWALGAGDEGHTKRAVEKTVAINDKYIVLGLQAHQLNKGVIDVLEADRGGQWLVYQPAL